MAVRSCSGSGQREHCPSRASMSTAGTTFNTLMALTQPLLPLADVSGNAIRSSLGSPIMGKVMGYLCHSLPPPPWGPPCLEVQSDTDDSALLLSGSGLTPKHIPHGSHRHAEPSTEPRAVPSTYLWCHGDTQSKSLPGLSTHPACSFVPRMLRTARCTQLAPSHCSAPAAPAPLPPSPRWPPSTASSCCSSSSSSSSSRRRWPWPRYVSCPALPWQHHLLSLLQPLAKLG